MQCGLIVFLTRSASIWLSLARCLALFGSLLLFEFAHKALAWLTRPLLGSQRWYWHIMMHIYAKQCEIMQKIQ